MYVHVTRPDDRQTQAAWRHLLDVGGVRTPFLLPQFALAGVATSAFAGTVRVLVVTDPTDQVVGLLPLEWSGSWPRTRALRAAGSTWIAPDHLEVVAEPGMRASVASAIARHLAVRSDWDLLDLPALEPGSELGRALQASPRVAQLPTEPVLAPRIDLRSGSDGLAWSRNLRQQVGRGLRAAERTGGGLEVVTGPAEVGQALDTLMRLHNSRFGAASRVFATPTRRRFHEMVAIALAADGRARVYRLTIAGGDAALLYAYVLGGTVYYYSMGLDPAVNGSPGRTVLGGAILHAAGEGMDEFDLLRGEHGFKLRFASEVRQDDAVRLLRPTAGGLGYALPRVLRRLRPSHWRP